MKKLFIAISVLFLICSCTLMNRVFLAKQISSYQGHSKNCKLYSSKDSTSIKYFEKLVGLCDINTNDSILSIGAGSGGREFLLSLFTDSILFYLQDIDTLCISKMRIDSTYYPHYSKLRGQQITNTFRTISGTKNSVFLPANKVNKVFIYNVYHHFSDDIAMVKECNRVLTEGGKLIIAEHVLKRNKKSYKFCDYGGYYKNESNFVSDIENCNFICDTIIEDGKYWRLFIFSKLG
ncbi:MAG: methyltransferase domain-containing protein [Bacteroidales bacterium]|nr:methyltransferase domain-containing protein [Bacteroidales bacterium]